MNAMAAIWVVLALVLVVVELHHVAFYALFGAVGAGVAAAIALVRPNAIPAQFICALIAVVVGVVVVRPYVSRAFPRSTTSPVATGVHGGFIGEKVFVLDLVSSEPGGHVRLAGESWLATTAANETLPAGSSAIVTGVRGTTLSVSATADHFVPASTSD